MCLFPGFPVKTGRVALTRQVQWAETACETVKFPPFSFYPDKEVHVQITTNHWNISIHNFIHEATVSWVQLVNHEGFQASKGLSSFNPFLYLLYKLNKLVRSLKQFSIECTKFCYFVHVYPPLEKTNICLMNPPPPQTDNYCRFYFYLFCFFVCLIFLCK